MTAFKIINAVTPAVIPPHQNTDLRNPLLTMQNPMMPSAKMKIMPVSLIATTVKGCAYLCQRSVNLSSRWIANSGEFIVRLTRLCCLSQFFLQYDPKQPLLSDILWQPAYS